jgi:hypothetical protein
MNGSMEQSPPQNMMRGLPHASVDPGSLPPEYWESLYANPEPPHHAHPPQQQLQQSQQPQQSQPMGISWDHPVFGQSPQQQRSPLPIQQQEHGHALFTPSTQAWRSNPLHPSQIMSSTPQGFTMPVQYRQVPQYSQGQVPFESQPLNASENPPYQPYSFPRNFYPPQHLAVPDTFSQTPPSQATQPQPSQSPAYQSNAPQNPLVSYNIPAGYSEETSVGQSSATHSRLVSNL